MKGGLLPLLAALVLTQAAAAGGVEHVNVNGAGRNSTNTFSKTLYVDVAVVSGFVKHSNDGDEGSWNGPNYHASLKASEGGPTSIGWGVDFDIAAHVTPLALARKHALTFGSWHVLQHGPLLVPHLVGGRKVGTLHAVMLLTQAPGSDATAFSSSVAFSLCKGVVVEVHFGSQGPSTSEPYQAGRWIMEDGTEVQPWTRDHLRAALDGVALDGYLPVGRVTAAARGRAVSGRVTDCLGHPMPGVTVLAGTAHAVTKADGAYAVRAASAGSIVVSASAGGGSA